MASDWVKSRDRAFQTQVACLVKIIADHREIWGLVEADLHVLTESKAAFETALTEQAERATAYHEAVAEKQAQRNRLERELRLMIRRINNHPGMTPALREAMELTAPTSVEARK